MEPLNADTILWTALKMGDRNALGQLFSAYYPILKKYGSKVCHDQNLLEDCIQDLFVEIWQSNAGSEIKSVKAYLLKALKYKIFKKLNPRLSRAEGPVDDMAFELSHDNFLIEQQENKEKIQKMMNAINGLPARQKEIIYLKIYQELSYEEVTDIMNIDYQVARNLMSQAVKTLRKLLLQFFVIWSIDCINNSFSV